MAMEALVHRELRRRGARVPEVVLFEPFDHQLGRSVLVTTEIEGDAIRDRTDMDLHDLLIDAGRDLALIGEMTVDGFGWIRKDPSVTSLEADGASARSLMLGSLDDDLAVLLERVLGRSEVADIERAVGSSAALLDGLPSRLAHGDFDDSHIFCNGAAYTGIIDFGEMRGAPPLYDAAHYALHDPSFEQPTLPSLLEGYAEVAPLPDDHEMQIGLLALLIGVRTLARVSDRPMPEYQHRLGTGIRGMTKTVLSD
jgi:aminoglycoside phosphotransferase (APT) family kinase protein